MTDSENMLRRLVEEGAAASSRPPLAELRRRVRRRRTATTATVATATAVAATVLAVSALVGHGRVPVPQTPGVLQPATTDSTSSAIPAPSLTAVPSVIMPGGNVILHGTGCAAGTTVGVSFARGAPSTSDDQGYKFPSVTALVTGAFAADLTIPPTAASGMATLSAQCESPISAHLLTLRVSITIQRGH